MTGRGRSHACNTYSQRRRVGGGNNAGRAGSYDGSRVVNNSILYADARTGAGAGVRLAVFARMAQPAWHCGAAIWRGDDCRSCFHGEYQPTARAHPVRGSAFAAWATGSLCAVAAHTAFTQFGEAVIGLVTAAVSYSVIGKMHGRVAPPVMEKLA